MQVGEAPEWKIGNLKGAIGAAATDKEPRERARFWSNHDSATRRDTFNPGDARNAAAGMDDHNAN